jgi:hypothetical protein
MMKVGWMRFFSAYFSKAALRMSPFVQSLSFFLSSSSRPSSAASLCAS